jgi:hydrogenase maturation protein HypF
MENKVATWEMHISGRVQGVGFRPALCCLAQTMQIVGQVANTGGAVTVICNGSQEKINSFVEAIKKLAEPIQVEQITLEETSKKSFANFTAVTSSGEAEEPVLTADIGICPDCLKEMENHEDPRFSYPYISCAKCGPRYTIIKSLPYDRNRTSMDEYTMCGLCHREYKDLTNRRCHGETLSCPNCGPQLFAFVRTGKSLEQLEKGLALGSAISLLEQGKIIAVKTVGGYNLCCRADKEDSVLKLRKLKQRPTKPLAVLIHDLLQGWKYCLISEAEAQLLKSAARPIVLIECQHNQEKLAPSIADENGPLGIFLPPQGLYALLTEKFPIVATSGNLSGQPLLFDDTEMLAFFAAKADVAGIFYYERDILQPADDSVTRIANGKRQILRRSRGYMPEPLSWKETFKNEKAILALGAHLEPALAMASARKVYPVAVPGDLGELATQDRFKEVMHSTKRLLNLEPKLVVCDLHPRYFTSELATKLDLPVVKVQHHQAHVLSVMAEHGLTGQVLGFAFDGTGYGPDQTVWGGEILRCEGSQCDRLGHLEAIPMLGGDVSMTQCWKSALCYLRAAGISEKAWRQSSLSSLLQKDRAINAAPATLMNDNFTLVQAALNSKTNVIVNSSMGRLFDAVSALLGLCAVNSHQGRGPMALEYAAEKALRLGIKPFNLTLTVDQEHLIYSSKEMLTKIVASAPTDKAKLAEYVLAVALGFHEAVRDMIVSAAKTAGLKQIALTGGVFANKLLLETTTTYLKNQGFAVYYNEQVPSGDGGLCLGQALYGRLYLEDIHK